jgi:hypothetical protein
MTSSMATTSNRETANCLFHLHASFHVRPFVLFSTARTTIIAPCRLYRSSIGFGWLWQRVLGGAVSFDYCWTHEWESILGSVSFPSSWTNIQWSDYQSMLPCLACDMYLLSCLLSSWLSIELPVVFHGCRWSHLSSSMVADRVVYRLPWTMLRLLISPYILYAVDLWRVTHINSWLFLSN